MVVFNSLIEMMNMNRESSLELIHNKKQEYIAILEIVDKNILDKIKDLFTSFKIDISSYNLESNYMLAFTSDNHYYFEYTRNKIDPRTLTSIYTDEFRNGNCIHVNDIRFKTPNILDILIYNELYNNNVQESKIYFLKSTNGTAAPYDFLVIKTISLYNSRFRVVNYSHDLLISYESINIDYDCKELYLKHLLNLKNNLTFDDYNNSLFWIFQELFFYIYLKWANSLDDFDLDKIELYNKNYVYYLDFDIKYYIGKHYDEFFNLVSIINKLKLETENEIIGFLKASGYKIEILTMPKKLYVKEDDK